MIARPEDIDPIPATGSMTMFARNVLDIAAQVEQAETAIKTAIVAAARDGDCARVIDIVTRWQTMPAVEVFMQKSPPSTPTCLD